MFDERHRRYVQSFFLVIPMTCIVTIVNTFIGKGPAAILTVMTLQKWAISIVIAYPSVLLVMPLAVKLTNRVMKKNE